MLRLCFVCLNKFKMITIQLATCGTAIQIIYKKLNHTWLLDNVLSINMKLCCRYCFSWGNGSMVNRLRKKMSSCLVYLSQNSCLCDHCTRHKSVIWSHVCELKMTICDVKPSGHGAAFVSLWSNVAFWWLCFCICEDDHSNTMWWPSQSRSEIK